MSQADSRSSDQTEDRNTPTTLQRYDTLAKFEVDIQNMLREKEALYGRAGGFYEANTDNYDHAVGELILKLKEWGRTGSSRTLVKAATWLYLIYETETLRGPK